MTNHLSPKEFAEAIGVCHQTVRRWLHKKHVRGRRVGPRGNWWIPTTELDRLGGKPQARNATQEEMDKIYEQAMADIRNS